MAESELTNAYADLRKQLGRHLGIDPDPTNWTTQQGNDVDFILRAGVRQLVQPPRTERGYSHRWTFLDQVYLLNTSAPYSTGTVAVASGVVTGTGTTFPSWAAQGEFTAEGTDSDAGVTFTVSSRDSDTQLTLDDTSVTITAGSSYELIRPTYDLPDNWAGWAGPLTFRPGDFHWYRTLKQTTWDRVRSKRQWEVTQYYPEAFAVRPKPFVSATGQRYEMIIYPTPDEVYRLEGMYSINPDKLDATDIYHIGGMRISECLLMSCMDKADEYLNDNVGGPYHQRFLEQLGPAIDADVRMTTADSLGVEHPRRDPADDHIDPHGGQVNNLVTYTGQTHAWTS